MLSFGRTIKNIIINFLGDLIGYILFFNTLDESRGPNAVNTGGHDDPVAVIEDLFVKPKYRGRGIATQLWRKVLKVSTYDIYIHKMILVKSKKPQGTIQKLEKFSF